MNYPGMKGGGMPGGAPGGFAAGKGQAGGQLGLSQRHLADVANALGKLQKTSEMVRVQKALSKVPTDAIPMLTPEQWKQELELPMGLLALLYGDAKWGKSQEITAPPPHVLGVPP